MKTYALLSSLVCCLLSSAGFASTYVWTGNAGGEWNVPGNWTVGGAVATAAPGSGDTLSITAATTSKPFTVTTSVTIPNPIVLGSGQQVFYIGASNVRATLTGVISGAGGLTATYLDCNGYLRLQGANTFTGGVTRDGAGQVEITHSCALGTGPFVGTLPASGTTAAIALAVRGDNLTIANDLTFPYEYNNGYKGCASFQSTTHLTGTVTFSGDTRIAGGSAVHFDGPTVIKGRLTTNSDTDYYFNTAITGGGYLHTDQGYGRWHLMQPGNALTHFYIHGSKNQNAVYLEAAGVVDSAFYVQYGNLTASFDSVIDLCGHAQTINRLYNGVRRHVVTTMCPATLTLAPTVNATWGGSFTGALSVDYAPPMGSYTLTSTGGVHMLTGDLKVSGGTVKLVHGASVANLSTLKIASAGTFDLDATAGDVAALLLQAEAGAILKIGAGRTVTVRRATVGGTALAANTYTSANLDSLITGAGQLVVTEGGTADNLWIWTGAAGGEWSTPGNWSVNGVVAQTAPPASATLYLATANDATPFTVTAQTTIPNPVQVVGSQQVVSNATPRQMVHFSGPVSGTGGFKAKFANCGYFRLSGNNTFSGGVTRCQPGRLDLFSATAAGTGTIELGNGSASGSGVANLPGLYVTGGLTIANTLKVGTESTVSWNGWWDGQEWKTTHFTGDVWFSGQTRYAAASTIYFDGIVHQAGRQVTKNLCTVYYRNAIQPNGGSKGCLWPDNGSGTVYLQASSNQLSAVQYGNMTDGRLYLEAEDAIAGVPIVWEDVSSAAATGTRIDLCGHDQHVRQLKEKYLRNPANHVVTSTARAKLTVNQDEASNFFTGCIEGGVSLELAATNAAAVYHLTSNALHATSGDFIATKGTLQLEGGARAPNLHAIEVGAEGRFVVDATAGTVAARVLRIAAGGTLTLPSDRTLTVRYVRVGATCLSTPTTITSADAAWLTSGTVVVTGLREGCLTWTGEAGGAWTEAGNWLNDQGENEAPVTTGDNLSRLFLTGAGQGAPLVFPASVTVDNELLLDEGLQTLQCDAAVTLRGAVSGAGGFLKTGTARLTLTGDQAFAGGIETLDGQLAADTVGAFGSGRVKVGAIFTGSPALLLQRGLTYTNDFEIESLNTAGGGNCCATIGALNASGRLTFAGNVSFVRNARYNMNHFRLAFPITFAGTVTMAGTTDKDAYNGHSFVMKSAGIVFEQPIVATSGNLYFFTDQSGSDMTFRGAGNAIKWLEIWGNTQTYKLACENALLPTSCIQAADNLGSTPGGSVDLGGYDQTVDSVFDLGVRTPAHAIVSPDGAATVTMKASADRFYQGDFADAVSIVWDPLGDYVYTLTNATLTTSGSITVKRGEVRLCDVTAAALTAIEVKSGAAFRLRGTSALAAELSALTLEEGATLDLDGAMGVFASVTYRGETLAGGQVYTHATLPELAEGTRLSVGANEAVWTGGAATTLMTEAANWQDGTPDLTNGTALATFATGGTRATLAADTSFRGINLTAADGFTFGGTLGTETLTLGASGLAVTAESARTDTVEVPVAAEAAQTWRVSGTAANTLNLNAGVRVPAGCTVRREQAAASLLVLKGSSTVDGRFEITNGATRVEGTVGGAGTVAWWRGDDVTGSVNLRFNGHTSTCAWEFAAQNTASAFADGTVTFSTGTTNVFNGRVTSPTAQHFRPIAASNASVVFAGGYDFNAVFVARGNAGSEYVFTGTPGRFGGGITDDSAGYVPHIRICSAGHDFANTGITLCGASSVDIEAENAVTNFSGFTLFGNCRIDLHGHDLACKRLTHSSSYIKVTPIGAVITSETAACLTVAESATVSNCVAFAGGVGLRKTAAGTMRLHGTSTSTGTVEVVAGTVEFAANGSWRKASAVQIAAGATNILNNRLTYGPETRLVLADGGALALNFEGNLKLGALVTGGTERRPGRYCAPGNTAALRAGATAVTGLTGTGVIQLGESGTCLIFR